MSSPSFKDIINAILHRLSLSLLRIRLFLQKKLNLTKRYQSDPFKKTNYSALREGNSRFEDINNNLPNEPLSCLDIGCNEGFFTFKMAERGGYCIGIDAGRNEIMVAEALKKTHCVENTLFSNTLLTEESFNGLPKFDVVIFLSVFHHIVRHNGLDNARHYMKAIYNINTKYLLFETGQPDEVNMSWSGEMGFMLPDIEKWVKNLLHEVGYIDIKVIGQHKAVKSDVDRLLFLAQK
jgi:SAM-dependent methyltransferase